MKKVMVIGCCGAGKSTFSKKLHGIINLELIHLDQHFWKPNWTETDKAEWKEIVTELAQRDRWIIDGNYGGTMDIRFKEADTIIYLDYNTIQCLWRITKRILKYRNTVRPDMPEGCKERFSLEFYHYVATYNLLRRQSTIKKLNKLSVNKTVITLSNDKEVEQYLEQLKRGIGEAN